MRNIIMQRNFIARKAGAKILLIRPLVYITLYLLAGSKGRH